MCLFSSCLSLFICVSFHLGVSFSPCLSLRLSALLDVSPLFLCLSVCLWVSLSVCLYGRKSLSLSLLVSVSASVSISIFITKMSLHAPFVLSYRLLRLAGDINPHAAAAATPAAAAATAASGCQETLTAADGGSDAGGGAAGWDVLLGGVVSYCQEATDAVGCLLSECEAFERRAKSRLRQQEKIQRQHAIHQKLERTVRHSCCCCCCCCCCLCCCCCCCCYYCC